MQSAGGGGLSHAGTSLDLWAIRDKLPAARDARRDQRSPRTFEISQDRQRIQNSVCTSFEFLSSRVRQRSSGFAIEGDSLVLAPLVPSLMADRTSTRATPRRDGHELGSPVKRRQIGRLRAGDLRVSPGASGQQETSSGPSRPLANHDATEPAVAELGPRVWEAPSGSGSGRLAINARSTDPQGTTATGTLSGFG